MRLLHILSILGWKNEWSSETENKKRTKNRNPIYINVLSTLAKEEQNRYINYQVSGCPAFQSGTGVIYHGSKRIAARRGQISGQEQGFGCGAVAN
jgi:hypothetical protein